MLKVCAVIEHIQDLKPGMTKEQASNHFRQTLRKNHNDTLKQNWLLQKEL